MKKQIIALSLLILLVFVAGCGTKTTGETTKTICDDTCKKERESYTSEVDALLTQAHEIIGKIKDDWKSVTKDDLSKMSSLKDKVSALNIPKDFDMIQDYYQRAFNHYFEATDYAVKANEQRVLASDPSNVQIRNSLLTKVVDNMQEANRIIIYAEEEEKFATRIASGI